MLLFFTIAGEARSLTFGEVHLMPRSVEKDYYIWRFLCQGNCTAAQADRIISEVNNLNDKLRSSYRAKTGRTAPCPPSDPNCKVTTPEERNAWITKASFQKNFKTGLRSLQDGDKDVALVYFEKARLSANKQSEADQAAYWLYLVTKSRNYLDLVLKSWDVNLYTLVARDSMHLKYPRTIIPKPFKSEISHYDDQNPIHWAHIKNKVKSGNHDLESFAEQYNSQESVGVYSYIKSKASKERNIYYPMPYRDLLSNLPKERQALIYAIARQESRFVPASVSRSFALGMMQIMPFLVEHIAGQRGERIDLDEMFNPRKAIVYANQHLNYLNSYLYNPLFVAYAYNAGIGFTKRLIQRNDYFRGGAYEPFMSIEKISNDEARDYGKKVLVNYVIYLNHLGGSARISSYLNELSNPSQTDKFRQ